MGFKLSSPTKSVRNLKVELKVKIDSLLFILCICQISAVDQLLVLAGGLCISNGEENRKSTVANLAESSG